MYRFTEGKEKYELVMETDLIPKAILEAQKVSPDESIRLMWKGAVYRDLENHDMRFSWKRFLMSLVP